MDVIGYLERLVASLYPSPIPIAMGMVLLIAVALVGAFRLRLHHVIGRHKMPAGIVAGVALVVLLPTGYYLASPLWIRTSLVEPMPASAGAEIGVVESAGPQSPAGVRDGTGVAGSVLTDAAVLRVIQRGEFVGADTFHFGRGRALISEVAPGRYTLRLEDFSVRNGPDLFVYLSTNPNGYAADAINLGRLKASDGAFNYDVPEGTELSKVKSVIVWCRQFSVLFATATLT